MMQSDRERARQLCEATSHVWREEYYGYHCENCGEFVPFGCEPWIPADIDDESEAEDDYDPAYSFGWDSYETEIRP